MPLRCVKICATASSERNVQLSRAFEVEACQGQNASSTSAQKKIHANRFCRSSYEDYRITLRWMCNKVVVHFTQRNISFWHHTSLIRFSSTRYSNQHNSIWRARAKCDNKSKTAIKMNRQIKHKITFLGRSYTLVSLVHQQTHGELRQTRASSYYAILRNTFVHAAFNDAIWFVVCGERVRAYKQRQIWQRRLKSGLVYLQQFFHFRFDSYTPTHLLPIHPSHTLSLIASYTVVYRRARMRVDERR